MMELLKKGKNNTVWQNLKYMIKVLREKCAINILMKIKIKRNSGAIFEIQEIIEVQKREDDRYESDIKIR